MKFQKADLIARVEAEIARREQDVADVNAKAQKTYEQNRQRYIDQTSDAWKVFADRIRVRLRSKQPITTEDIPTPLRSDRNYGYVTTWDTKQPAERTANTQALTVLLELLKASADDEVSDVALQRMGFRMGDLFPAR